MVAAKKFGSEREIRPSFQELERGRAERFKKIEKAYEGRGLDSYVNALFENPKAHAEDFFVVAMFLRRKILDGEKEYTPLINIVIDKWETLSGEQFPKEYV